MIYLLVSYQWVWPRGLLLQHETRTMGTIKIWVNPFKKFKVRSLLKKRFQNVL